MLQRSRILINTCKKSVDNIEDHLLKRYKIHITSDSNNAIQEFRNYKWKEDRSGKLINVPEDKHNHIIDPCRYATYSLLSRPNFGKYTIQ